MLVFNTWPSVGYFKAKPEEFVRMSWFKGIYWRGQDRKIIVQGQPGVYIWVREVNHSESWTLLQEDPLSIKITQVKKSINTCITSSMGSDKPTLQVCTHIHRHKWINTFKNLLKQGLIKLCSKNIVVKSQNLGLFFKTNRNIIVPLKTTS